MEHVKTCKWFDASEYTANKNGSASNKFFPYNKHLHYNSCWSPTRSHKEAQRSPEACNMACPISSVEDFETCTYYEQEPIEVLRLMSAKVDDSFVFVSLDRTRLNLGVAEYRVITWRQDNDDECSMNNTASLVVAINSLSNPVDHYKLALEIFDDAIEKMSSELSAAFIAVDSTIDANYATSYPEFILAQR